MVDWLLFRASQSGDPFTGLSRPHRWGSATLEPGKYWFNRSPDPCTPPRCVEVEGQNALTVGQTWHLCLRQVTHSHSPQESRPPEAPSWLREQGPLLGRPLCRSQPLVRPFDVPGGVRVSA